MSIIINPGSGPVEGATQDLALANMRRLIIDLTDQHGPGWGLADTPPIDIGDGRWTYIVGYGEQKTYEVDMPGLPTERVRYLGAPDQDIWDFPRLYVDGSSWVWMYALNVMNPKEL